MPKPACWPSPAARSEAGAVSVTFDLTDRMVVITGGTADASRFVTGTVLDVDGDAIG